MIKVAALDVYGTILAVDDETSSYPPRAGLEDFLDSCEKKGIIAVTSSDADIIEMREELKSVFSYNPLRRLSIDRFKKHFRLEGAKDFSEVYGFYDIIPSELLVIGDSPKDANAIIHGCKFIQCPMYTRGIDDSWNFKLIPLENY